MEYIIGILIIIGIIEGYIIYKLYINNKKNEFELNTKIALLAKKNKDMTLDFTKDQEFLLNKINSTINEKLETLIQPIDASNTTVINTKKLESIAKEIISEVYGSLSDNYKNVLYRYYKPNALVDYITSIVYIAVLKEVNKLNRKKILK